MKRYVGEWWISQEPDQSCRGELEVEPFERATLVLRGRLPGVGYSSEGSSIELLLGRTDSGQLLTAYKCGVEEVIPGPDFQVKATLFVNYVAVGAHFERPEHLKFSAVRVDFEHLAEWTGRRVIDVDRTADSEDDRRLTVTYRPPEVVEVDVSGLKIRLLSRSTMRGIHGPRFRLDHQPYVKFIPDEPKLLTTYREVVCTPFQLLLAFGTDAGVSFERFEGVLPEDTEARKSTDNNRIEVFFLDRGQDDQHKTDVGLMFFQMRDLGNEAEKALRVWYEKVEWLASIAGYYAAALYRPGYSENVFLNLTQALESYHRKCPRYDGKYLPPDRYEELVFDPLIDAFPDDVPDDLRGSMSALRDSFKDGRLKFGNEYSLRKRLTELVEDVPDLVHPALNPDPGGFVKQVKDTRNYLVHLDEDAREDAASGPELQYLASGLRTLLRALLFKEMDLSEDKQRNIFERSIWFQELSNM